MLNLDKIIIEFDKGLRTLFSQAHSVRAHPDAGMAEGALSESEKNNAAALMRVNHCGEICAQALYQGQALTARDPQVQRKLGEAAQEETEHLAWTAQRVYELGGHVSVLNPLWYSSSLAIGAVAGVLGDKWNLGFLAETERQVGAHLQSHLNALPQNDARSRAVVQQMYIDETQHAEMAAGLGAAELPPPVKLAMQLSGKLMTRTAYWV
ncbi:MAG: demethoxyubiquinone hydroxylase family protein [Gallionellales bacterium 35-53-114]|jgi:ubiquinone biosynthesis monooxygenase Coq7|nr:MAG: demethoxyubiquinone hydroxylase family protein [Gallionellales bacterium 35-53-114]OYZ64276.1 MAG: demethoxyubiquinone hydroxylase family protein [Gallionellales bacterium 24-53-125]OZB10416.1 MAG: demethoxyubiquinone hydroxylase family protein [Gallionellales bacterium 39-52-133]HQS57028.1 2-polyprenyl-3-methyl-6-methoxy-1,4-benzoquinone monooxygenase [Gallionellaceae bacterium]HQS75188.1 2-polyprenyl-3-methyl-6-methoxy-1,4-benzoquinone monooxygenase [Gallionellaceae bacterium]